MQRELKFRAWDGKIMHEWGFLQEGTFIGPPSNSRGNFQTMKHMQFIGLLDKNGKEIYESDIVYLKTKSWNNNKDCSCWKKEIVWIKCLNLTCTKAFFDLKAKKMWDNGYSYEDYSDDWELTENKEVIGNIYQHPELLEETK